MFLRGKIGQFSCTEIVFAESLLEPGSLGKQSYFAGET